METVVDSVALPKKSFREILGAAPAALNQSVVDVDEVQQEHKPRKQRQQKKKGNKNNKQYENKQLPLSLDEAITLGDSNSTRVRRIRSDMAASKAKADEAAAAPFADGFQKVKTRKVPIKKEERKQEPRASSKTPYVPKGLPLTFEEMKVGNLYLVRTLPDYWGASKYQNYLMKCTALYVQNGKNIVEYKMVLDLCLVPGDPGENCGTRYGGDEFSNQTFKRIPSDLFTNYSKYENTIQLRYFDESAALDYMY
jgi:hypothetical protein